MYTKWKGFIMVLTVGTVAAELPKPFQCVSQLDINSTEAALKSALFCGTSYNPRYRPVKYQQDRLAMYIGAEVINVERVRTDDAKLEVTLELLMQWYDAFLHWNKRSSHNIETINVSEHDLWTPTFAAKSFQKSPRIQSTLTCSRIKCHLSYDGEVIYTVLCTFMVDCYAEARYWAFDTKLCTLRIYSAEYDTNQLSLFHFQRRLSYPSYPLLPYKITSFQMATVNSTMSPEFRMDIVIERLIGSHLVVFLMLIVVLSLLNLVIPWLRVDSTARTVTIILTTVLQTLFLVLLYWYGVVKMKPVISLAHLLLGTFLFGVLVLAWTYYVRAQIDGSHGPQQGLGQFVSVLRKNRPLGAFLAIGYLNESSKGELSSDWEDGHHEPTHAPAHGREDDSDGPTADGEDCYVEWSEIVQPCDRILFCAMLTAYFILYGVYAF
ncbi:proton-gated ion channel subunit pbo-6-like [Anopheles bellator]|uniref:proton-gated ion channel subunit pbo-6-like n=1 Tax=Anopheles bellator TaxID=139047 RepID=UPI002647877B|nr:proton-gated ion channel subunit pbo-6-like [Anopheles bellator]